MNGWGGTCEVHLTTFAIVFLWAAPARADVEIVFTTQFTFDQSVGILGDFAAPISNVWSATFTATGPPLNNGMSTLTGEFIFSQVPNPLLCCYWAR
jgi:hypothetical protein